MKRVIVGKRSGYIEGEEAECWPWFGSCDPNGYGQAWDGVRKKLGKAHRVVWEKIHGTPLPAKNTGLELDHLCNNRKCVNPKHLEIVPHRVNMHRANARRWAAA